MKKLNTIFSFVLLSFCLLINVSFAEIVANQSYIATDTSTSTTISSDETYVEGYTYYLVDTILTNYGNDITNETYINDFNNMVSAFENAGKNVTVFKTMYSSKYYVSIVAYDSDSNVCLSGSSYRIGFILDDTSQTKSFDFFNTRQYRFNTITCTPGTPFAYLNDQCYEVFYSSTDVYQLEKNDSGSGYSWDGTSYYYKAPVKEDPFANYDLANIISIIKNSTEIKDNIKSYLSDEYFIVPDGTVGDEEVYEIYFYHNMINLSQFEYVYNDILYYDLDKAFLLDENIVVNLIYWLGQNSYAEIVHDVQLFTLYYNPETGTGDIYLTSSMTLNELKSFNSETQPIIYTTKDIAYYSATWGETDTEWTATADETKNVLTTEVVDSEGNVINPSVSDTPDLTVIIENVNFDEINKTFEENKGILNIENASWLFTANNKLIGYFIGFLSLLIVFLIISRVLGG